MTEPVRVATDVDAATVADIHTKGFLADPVLSWVFDEPGREAKLAAFWGFLAPEALVPLGHAYLVGRATAVWTPPESPDWPAERSDRLGALLTETCTADDVDRIRRLDEVLSANHPDEPLWYLGTIAVDPVAQGSGLGGRLLTESLTVVDRSGLPAYLEATSERSVPLYERHGFRRGADLTVPGGPTLVAMHRDPR